MFRRDNKGACIRDHQFLWILRSVSMVWRLAPLYFIKKAKKCFYTAKNHECIFRIMFHGVLSHYSRARYIVVADRSFTLVHVVTTTFFLRLCHLVKYIYYYFTNTALSVPKIKNFYYYIRLCVFQYNNKLSYLFSYRSGFFHVQPRVSEKKRTICYALFTSVFPFFFCYQQNLFSFWVTQQGILVQTYWHTCLVLAWDAQDCVCLYLWRTHEDFAFQKNVTIF